MGFYVIALGSNESHLRHGFPMSCKGMSFEKALEHDVALFLAKLSGVKSVTTVKQLCVEEKGWFENAVTRMATPALRT